RLDVFLVLRDGCGGPSRTTIVHHAVEYRWVDTTGVSHAHRVDRDWVYRANVSKPGDGSGWFRVLLILGHAGVVTIGQHRQHVRSTIELVVVKGMPGGVVVPGVVGRRVPVGAHGI